MLLEIKFDRASEENFTKCTDILCTSVGCRVLDKKRYLTMKHMVGLLQMKPKKIVEFLIDSKVIHGFMLEGEVYVHPDKFAKKYLRLLVECIDREVGSSAEMVH